MTDESRRELLASLATRLDEAARTATPIRQLTDDDPDLTEDEAIAIQALSIERRLSRGERRVGVKMGLTSRAKMAQVGVHQVLWGRLTDAMRREDGGEVAMSDFIHPRAEPEVAVLIARPLAGPVSPMEALAACEAVAPAIEVIDSRYANFRFRLPDVVADNASSSAFVLGPWSPPSADVANLGIVVTVDGEAVQIGSSAAILGHPLRSLAAAAQRVAAAGERLEPGYIVMAGGATAATPLAAGTHVKADVESLGAVSFTVR
ncbi:MAG: 2-keto-4-pentenoate hydratase [Sandaracinaceae bacterium]